MKLVSGYLQCYNQCSYSSASSCIRISSNEATDLFKCQRGVRQGCILSPLLFAFFTAELEREIKKNNSGIELHNGNILDIIMYADDVVLISSSAAGLRKHITTLSDFSQRRKTEKTKICVFGGDRNSNLFSLNNHIPEKVQSYKYLGIWFTKNGKFLVAKKHLANQANKGMFLLLRHLDNPPIPVYTTAL